MCFRHSIDFLCSIVQNKVASAVHVFLEFWVKSFTVIIQSRHRLLKGSIDWHFSTTFSDNRVNRIWKF